MPFFIVENENFIQFIEELNPKFVFPLRKKLIDNILSDLYNSKLNTILN